MAERPLRIALTGRHEGWAAALHSAGAAVVAMDAWGEADGLVVAQDAEEPFAQAQRALQRGVPVLLAAGQSPNPQEAAALAASWGPGAPFLRFWEPFRYRAGFSLVRRFLSGPEPFWKPLYLRAVSVGRPGGRLEELAVEQLATAAALLDGEAELASGTAVRSPEGAEASALFLNVTYRGGVQLFATATASEGPAAEQLALVTAERTLTIEGAAGHGRVRIDGPCSPGGRTVAARGADPVAGEIALFLRAVRAGDASAGNSARWMSVARAWWALKQSIAQHGTPVFVSQAPHFGEETQTPRLNVIEGGGAPGRESRRPALSLIAS